MKTEAVKFRRRLALVTSALLVCILTLRIVQRSDLPITSILTTRPRNQHLRGNMARAPLPLFEKSPVPIGVDRGKIAQALRASFRRDQVRIELAIEQRRYGRDYWETGLGGNQLRELDRVRSVRLEGLAREMNGILNELCGDEPGEMIALTPIFDAGHPGPNIGFLSPESREKAEELIARDSLENSPDTARLLAEMETVLTGGEAVQYRQWNSPGHVLLRNQLVGFNATEAEFNAIAQWPGFVNQGNSSTGDDNPAMLQLAATIGVQRVADLIRLRDPEIQTAVHDLHRLGLPLDQAESLAALRSAGIGEIQQTWTDPAVPSAMKELHVRQLLGDYRARIAATFRIATNSSDATDLLP